MNPQQPRKRPASSRKPARPSTGTRKPTQRSASKRAPAKRPANRQELVKRLREPRIAALIGGGIAVIVVAILLISGGGGDENKNSGAASGNGGGTTTQATNPIEVSADRLREIAGVVGHPVYWAGTQPGKKYELSITSDQNIFIRYLDPNVPIGSKSFAALTVGTYPVRDATSALQREADKPAAKTDTAPGGGFVLTSADAPQSVYIAYPDSNYEIEIFDPVPQKALSLATSGAIVPIK